MMRRIKFLKFFNKETVLTHLIDHNSGQCLDYIFQVKREIVDLKIEKENNNAKKCSQMQMEKFFCKRKNGFYAKVERFEISGEDFQQLSDHNAVELKIKLD